VARDELVSRDGQLELQSVAKAAGVVPSAISHHFGSRSGLICAVVDGFFDALHSEVLDRDLRPLGPWEYRELERTRRAVEFSYGDALAPVIYGLLGRDGQVAALETRRIDRVVEASARNIAAAQRDGELAKGADPRLAAAAIFGAVRQVIVTSLRADPRPTQESVVDQVWRVTVAAVAPAAGPAPLRTPRETARETARETPR
jgi:AcrR family transcriptional regulator